MVTHGYKKQRLSQMIHGAKVQYQTQQLVVFGRKIDNVHSLWIRVMKECLAP